ncbi:MAG: ImmA/IrrE family metallo-endopeptidase [Methylococcales bacterium]|jgi:Zn-dependent peptidase ImmA (M78 family)|nr:ImmA/IrrE family metallo-endopeptidase [Methylococcales bacterium]
MDTLQISPSILHWAANQCGLSVDALVDLLECPSKHEALVSGQLTIKQIEKLAKKTHIPFGYFFLDTPPQTTRSSIPDLRQLPNPMPLSAEFFDTLDDVLRKQLWYLDYLKEQGADKLDFVGKFKFDQSVSIETIAADIRDTLNLTIEEQKKCAKFESFFTLLSERIENIGILVFRNSIVKSNTRRGLSVNEFRGFAIANNYAPIIFINGKDSESAWIFTLAHELAHIWLGESGVSDIPDKQKVDDYKLEKYCNQIAAELLTPKKLFLSAWEKLPEPKIEALSREFKVSQWVIARRAYDLRKISWNDYLRITEAGGKIKQHKGSPSPYVIYPIRNSKRLTRTIVNAAMSGNMMLREAASLLNIKPDTVMEMGRRRSI